MVILFKSSFMAMGNGRHMLPVKAEIRRAIGKEVGKTVKVILKERMRSSKTRARTLPRQSISAKRAGIPV